MSKRPLPVTLIAWLFMVIGSVSIPRGVLPLFNMSGRSESPDIKKHTIEEFFEVSGSGVLALVGGIFTLRGKSWARWLCLIWMGGHVILSLLHTPFELMIHSVFFVLILYALFRPQSSGYFAGRGASL